MFGKLFSFGKRSPAQYARAQVRCKARHALVFRIIGQQFQRFVQRQPRFPQHAGYAALSHQDLLA